MSSMRIAILLKWFFKHHFCEHTVSWAKSLKYDFHSYHIVQNAYFRQIFIEFKYIVYIFLKSLTGEYSKLQPHQKISLKQSKHFGAAEILRPPFKAWVLELRREPLRKISSQICLRYTPRPVHYADERGCSSLNSKL